MQSNKVPHTGKVERQKKQKSDRTVVLQPSVVVLATYILLLLSKLIDITLINRENEYFSVVVLQMMIFLLPAAIWCKFSGEGYVSRLRLRLPSIRSIPLLISSALLMISGGLLISVLFGGLESLSSNFSLYGTFISKDNGTLPTKLYLILAYAALPAVCEEFVFRGIVCHEYERGGVLRAVAFSSLFFGMLHFDLPNLPVYLFAGAILALTLYSSRSLFGAMIAHFLYNLFGLFGQPYMSALYNLTGSRSFFLFLVATVFFVSGAVFCSSASALYKKYLYLGYSANYRRPVLTEPSQIRRSYLDVVRAPSAIACLAVYIIALIISWL